MPEITRQPSLPIWLRVIIVVTLLVMVYFSQREAELPQPPARPADTVTPTAPVTIKVVREDEQPNPPASPAESTPPTTASSTAPAPTPETSKSPDKPTPVKSSQKSPPVRPAPVEAKSKPKPTTSPLVITNVKLKDQSGRTIYQGDIDLEPTLARIDEGQRLERFPNDGSTFQNRERRLPKQPSGYYREYVVPTPDERGPGPQRLVIGKEGEVFYTHDHYKTFRRVK